MHFLAVPRHPRQLGAHSQAWAGALAACSGRARLPGLRQPHSVASLAVGGSRAPLPSALLRELDGE